MTRLQKAMTIIALVLFLAGAIAGELWEASHSPHAPQQSAATEKKDTTSPKTIEERHEAAEEAIATYTLWLMAFTAVLAIATIALGVGTFFQIRLARSEFLANNRPILRVRYFRQTAGDHDQIQIRFAVVNAGRSRGYLLGSSVVVSFADPNRLGPPVYATGIDVTLPRNFEVGASDEYIALGDAKGIEIRKAESAGQYLIVHGYLVYRDDAGTTRTTAFGRRYFRTRERFTKIEDDDYEYED
jgi:hypothetical protein